MRRTIGDEWYNLAQQHAQPTRQSRKGVGKPSVTGGRLGLGDVMSNQERVPSWLQNRWAARPWNNQTQLVTTITLIVIVGVLIGALYLIQTTTTTTTARVLSQMSEERDRLVRENERLRVEIAELQSMPLRLTRAAEMGFRTAGPEDIQYIIVDGYRYDRDPVTPTPTSTPTPVAPEYPDTFEGWLRKQWDALKQQFEEWRSGTE